MLAVVIDRMSISHSTPLLVSRRALRGARRRLLAWASVCGLVTVIGLLGNTASARGSAAWRASASACPWLNQSLPVPERVEHADVAHEPDRQDRRDVHRSGRRRAVRTPATRATCRPSRRCASPLSSSRTVRSAWRYGATDVTQLPAEVSLGSAWDPSLAYQYGVVNGQEHRAKGIAMVLGPGVNIQRDPAGGATSRCSARIRS